MNLQQFQVSIFINFSSYSSIRINYLIDTCKNELQVFENLKSEKFQNLFKTFVQINMEIELQITNCWKLMLNKL